MKTFTDAQNKAIKRIMSEPADNGMHMAWINTKARHAKEMTEDTMTEILKTKSEGLNDAAAKYGVAQLIQHLMK